MELVFLVPIAALAAATFIVKWSLEYHKWKWEARQRGASPDNSLPTSELKMLIREAMDEANAPLVERIEALEARSDTPAHAPLLDASLDAYETEPMPVTQRQRVS